MEGIIRNKLNIPKAFWLKRTLGDPEKPLRSRSRILVSCDLDTQFENET